MGIYCIAHQETLAVHDKYFRDFNFIDQALNWVYEWLVWSLICRRVIKRLLEIFCNEVRVILHIHNVWWLFQVKVMACLIYCMLVIFEVWEIDEPIWFHNVILFQFQMFIHFLAVVLVELNKLNKRKQCDHVDITAIASTLIRCGNYNVKAPILRITFWMDFQAFRDVSSWNYTNMHDDIYQFLWYRKKNPHLLHEEKMFGCQHAGTSRHVKSLVQSMFKL